MSKANEWARREVKELYIRQMGSPYTVNVFLVIEAGKPGMRIDNLGPFDARQALRLARWIQDAFAERSEARG